MKEELSEWNEYCKRILYRIDIVPTGGNRGAGERGVRGFIQYCYTYHYYNLIYVILSLIIQEMVMAHTHGTIFSVLTMMAYKVC